ncbi:hypothetical protein HN011_007899 [Eciton burchellii]|nr:hypothetical protein HN011_007899 [Eciton burchellii]
MPPQAPLESFYLLSNLWSLFVTCSQLFVISKVLVTIQLASLFSSPFPRDFNDALPPFAPERCASRELQDEETRIPIIRELRDRNYEIRVRRLGIVCLETTSLCGSRYVEVFAQDLRPSSPPASRLPRLGLLLDISRLKFPVFPAFLPVSCVHLSAVYNPPFPASRIAPGKNDVFEGDQSERLPASARLVPTQRRMDGRWS